MESEKIWDVHLEMFDFSMAGLNSRWVLHRDYHRIIISKYGELL